MNTTKGNAVEILLVEDNPGDARLIRELLSETTDCRFSCTWVESLGKAIEAVKNPSIDVVLLDLSLPDSRGFDTFERLHSAAAEVPIILLTGLNDQELAVRTVHSGAQDYLIKGQLDGALLSRAMRYAIERQKAAQKLASYAEALRVRNEQMQADLDMAREVQLAFLPRQESGYARGLADRCGGLQFYHRYQPTAALAGDFFDIIPLDSESVGIFICDVMGHGVRAALMTAFLRGLIEELAPVADSPGSFLTQLNRGLYAVLNHSASFLFASALYIVVDTAAGVVRFARAGHPEALHLRRGASVVEPMKGQSQKPGPALGLLETVHYRTDQRTLASDDRILMYTDGVYEVMDSDGEQFGEDRLLASVRRRLNQPPEQLLDGLLGEVREFGGGREFEDDVCLVCIDASRLAGAARANARSAFAVAAV